MSGIDLLRRLKELNIAVPVIVITGHGDVPLAVEAMKIGAADFLEKPFDDEVLLASVRSALRQRDGEKKRHSERAEIDSRLATLSNRERDVLGGLVAGRANKQIALRSRHQPAHRGDLPGKPDEQNAGGKPVRARAHGAHRRDSGVRINSTRVLLSSGPRKRGPLSRVALTGARAERENRLNSVG